MSKPFWEQAYSDPNAAAFSKGPTKDVAERFGLLAPRSRVLDVGCGEGRNAIFLAEQGHLVDAFDISEAGIAKAKAIAAQKQLAIHFWAQNLTLFHFSGPYDVILSHGVLHLPEKTARNAFLRRAKANTKPGGLHFIGIFTNRLPVTPDNAPFTKSLFDMGELPALYSDWALLEHHEGTFHDTHPGGFEHDHAYERIIARKPDAHHI